MERTPVLKFLAFSTLTALALVAQENEAPIVFRSDVALARVDAQVTDRTGRPITTLSKEDFEIYERGTRREISNFSREDMPLDVLILLDVSGSMRPHVERIASATREALLVLSRKDRVAIMVFDRQTRTSMPFRSNQDEIVRGMNAVLQQEDFNGGTDITRALFDATRYMNNNARRDARRAIVILTDDRTERGRDVRGVVAALGEANTVLSALITPDAMGGRGGIRIPTGRRGGGGIFDDIIFGRRMPTGGGRLPGGGTIGGGLNSAGTAEIARNSGGDSMDVNDSSALEATLEKIRQSYALFFNGEGAGVREVEVSLTADALRRYPGAEINYRRNYQMDDSGGGGQMPTSTSRRPSTPHIPEPKADDAGQDAPNQDTPKVTKRRPAVDEPSSSPSTAPTTPKAEGEEQPSKGGFRRLKPGEKP
jgi:VWFA-related protein